MVSAVYQPIEQFAHIVKFPLSAHGRAGSPQRLLIFSKSEGTNFCAHLKAVSKHFLAARAAKKCLELEFAVPIAAVKYFIPSLAAITTFVNSILPTYKN